MENSVSYKQSGKYILQLSLRNSSYTIVILISITERRSVALTCSGFKSDSVSFFFHKSPKQV